MAVDMFLELDGITGESVDAKHKDKIDVLGWGWGVSNTGKFHFGSGGGASRATAKVFAIKKHIDRASCALIQCVCTGKHVAKGSLIVRKAGGNPLEYLVFKFTDLFITHSHPEVDSETGTEIIAFKFSKQVLEGRSRVQTAGCQRAGQAGNCDRVGAGRV